MLVSVYFSYCDVDHYSSIFNLKINVKEKTTPDNIKQAVSRERLRAFVV